MGETAGSIGQAEIAKFLNGFPARSFGDTILQYRDLFWQSRPPWLPELLSKHLFAFAARSLDRCVIGVDGCSIGFSSIKKE